MGATIDAAGTTTARATPANMDAMTILYCGDANIRDGVLVSVCSLLANQQAPLDIMLVTARFTGPARRYHAIDEFFATRLDVYVRGERPGSRVRLIDATRQFCAHPPSANLSTRFTPLCMLRLYVDLMPELDGLERVLYLDNDVLCRADPAPLYHHDLGGAEIGGVLDRYGRWFFHSELRPWDYLNSGVLLMDLGRIRQTGLLARCRKLCARRQMFMPDQSALNKLARGKRILPRRFNEQGRLRPDTVLQHFSSRFSIRGLVSVKPWQIQEMHEVLGIHAYDEVLERYQHLRPAFIE